jgi:hypothetical protein
MGRTFADLELGSAVAARGVRERPSDSLHAALSFERGPKSSKVRKRPGCEFRFAYDSAHEEYESELAGLFAGQIVAGCTV